MSTTNTISEELLRSDRVLSLVRVLGRADPAFG